MVHGYAYVGRRLAVAYGDVGYIVGCGIGAFVRGHVEVVEPYGETELLLVALQLALCGHHCVGLSTDAYGGDALPPCKVRDARSAQYYDERGMQHYHGCVHALAAVPYPCHAAYGEHGPQCREPPSTVHPVGNEVAALVLLHYGGGRHAAHYGHIHYV